MFKKNVKKVLRDHNEPLRWLGFCGAHLLHIRSAPQAFAA